MLEICTITWSLDHWFFWAFLPVQPLLSYEIAILGPFLKVSNSFFSVEIHIIILSNFSVVCWFEVVLLASLYIFYCCKFFVQIVILRNSCIWPFKLIWFVKKFLYLIHNIKVPVYWKATPLGRENSRYRSAMGRLKGSKSRVVEDAKTDDSNRREPHLILNEQLGWNSGAAPSCSYDSATDTVVTL